MRRGQNSNIEVNEILETQKVKGVKLLLPSERSRVTPRGTRMGNDESAYRTLFVIKLKVYGKYPHELVNHFVLRFHAWPKWLLLCNETFFNFENDLSNEVRMEQFD